MFLPAEIHENIFGYIVDLEDQVSWSRIDQTARSTVKISKCLPEIYDSCNINQAFLNSPIMSDVVELNINHNKRSLDLRHLKNLKVLHCEQTRITSRAIKGLGIETLYFHGNKGIIHLANLPKLKHVDIYYNQLIEQDLGLICYACIAIFMGIIFLLIFLTFIAAFLPIFFIQLYPQLKAKVGIDQAYLINFIVIGLFALISFVISCSLLIAGSSCCYYIERYAKNNRKKYESLEII